MLCACTSTGQTGASTLVFLLSDCVHIVFRPNKTAFTLFFVLSDSVHIVVRPIRQRSNCFSSCQKAFTLVFVLSDSVHTDFRPIRQRSHWFLSYQTTFTLFFVLSDCVLTGFRSVSVAVTSDSRGLWQSLPCGARTDKAKGQIRYLLRHDTATLIGFSAASAVCHFASY